MLKLAFLPLMSLTFRFAKINYDLVCRCDHRASKGVRITASIFLSELRPESVEEVAGHE